MEKSALEQQVLDTVRAVAYAMGVYSVGWFGFHWVWLFGGVVFYMMFRKVKRRDEKRTIFGATVQDEAALLLKYEDLPTWVSCYKFLISFLFPLPFNQQS